MWGKTDDILLRSEYLEQFANHLEKTASRWSPIDYSLTNWNRIKSSKSEFRNYRKRADIVWANAVRTGMIIFELCGIGAFDEQRRIKNMILQIRAQLEACLNEFTIPARANGWMIQYEPTGSSLDIFFVRIFESFCKISIKSQKDQGVSGTYYDNIKRAALLHVKVMLGLSKDLKSRFRKPI
jgi:hypothetical protein